MHDTGANIRAQFRAAMHFAEIVEHPYAIPSRNSAHYCVLVVKGQPQLGIIKFTEGTGDHFFVAGTHECERKARILNFLITERSLSECRRSEVNFSIRGVR